MSEKEIEIKSEEIVEEQEGNVETDSVEDNVNMRIFPWSWEKFEKYEYGDLHLWCRNCGKDNPMKHPGMKNMQTMMPINPLPVDNEGMLALGCENCGTQLALHFRKAANPPAEDEIKEKESEEATDTPESEKVKEKE